MGYAFISYSTKNQASADAMRELFNKHNIDTWMAPYDIPAGSKYAAVITKSIRDCSCFVLLLSNDSQASEAVDSEVELAALTFKKSIITVELEKVILNDAFTFYIHNKQIIPVHKIDEDSREIKQILEAVGAYTNAFSIDDKLKYRFGFSIETGDSLMSAESTSLNDEDSIQGETSVIQYSNSVNSDSVDEISAIDNETPKKSLNGVEINESNFPDEAFRNYVKKNFDKDKNGILSPAEIKSVTEIDISGKSCKSLKGIEYFTVLENLSCGRNQLISLDVSQNTVLRSLMCWSNQLTSLDVSKNAALEALRCDYNQLTSLDISKNTVLESLWCDNNRLTSLDVSKNTALISLNCSRNKLKMLDMSQNTLLKKLEYTGNKSGFTLVGQNSDFEDKTPKKSLNGVEINESNFPDEAFRNYVKENFDKDKNGILSTMEIYAVTKIDITHKNCRSLKGIEYFIALETLFCDNNLLKNLDVSKNIALKTLWCDNNRIENLDISKNRMLKLLYCHKNELMNLDISKNTALETLWCDNNRLINLDVSKNTALKTLWCERNCLESLDVSENMMLEDLRCDNNQLKRLDISKNSRLVSLECFNNDNNFMLVGWKRVKKTVQADIINHYKSKGLCAHCGGTFFGVFKKKCTKCGKEKDY